MIIHSIIQPKYDPIYNLWSMIFLLNCAKYKQELITEDSDMDRSSSSSPEDNAQSHLSIDSEARFVEIRVKGQLDSKWSQWLEGFQVRLLDNGEMILFGSIVDQAALMGVLNKLAHLNLTLLSLNEVQNTNSSGENK